MDADKLVTCRVCGKPFIRSGLLGHAKRFHPMQFYNWMRSRTDFGISILEHVEHRRVPVSVVRQ